MQSAPLLVFLEGNINSGKTTLLKSLNESSEFEFHVYPERFADCELMTKRYKDSVSHAFELQRYIIQCYRKIFQEIDDDIKNQSKMKQSKRHVYVVERSLFSAFFVFVEILKEKGEITKQQYDTLFLESISSSVKPDYIDNVLFVLFDTKPKMCYDRILSQNVYSNYITLPYIESIELKHIDMFQFLRKKGYLTETISSGSKETVKSSFLSLLVFH